VVVSLDDAGRNLRAEMPVLAAAFMAALGRNTQGPAPIAIGRDDPAVSFINRGR
jgi:hypothetical protein